MKLRVYFPREIVTSRFFNFMFLIPSIEIQKLQIKKNIDTL